MIFRIVKFSAIGLIAAYAVFLTGLFASQRDFIFQVPSESVLLEADALAIKESTRVRIPTGDGETLAGWYRPPKDKNGRVFLFFHGNIGLKEGMKWRWQRIAKHGEGILAFSYRGYPGSTGSPSEEGLFEDARAAYAWLSKKHSPDQIILHGFSLGTGVATKLATEVEPYALILEAPYKAVVDLAGEQYPYFPVSYVLWDQFRTRDYIAHVKAPVMIAHGEQDSVIPFSHAEELYELAVEPKVFVPMAGSDHNSLVRDGVYEFIWKFIDNPRGYKGPSAT